MFHTSQCVMSIFEPLLSTGSGSCISRTKLCVPAGTWDHFNSGDTAAAAAIVYLSGMTPPSCHAVVVMISGGAAGPRPRSEERRVGKEGRAARARAGEKE